MFGISPYQSLLFPDRDEQLLWPPIPKAPGLLCSNPSPIYEAYKKPREEWSADEWRLWAGFLEQEGNYLHTKIDKLQNENFSLRSKLSRRKVTGEDQKSRNIPTGLLAPILRKKGGRPATRKETAAELLKLEREMTPATGARPKANVVIATYFGGSLPRDAGNWRSQMTKARKLQNPGT